MATHNFSLRFRRGVTVTTTPERRIRIRLGDLYTDRPDTPESQRLFETLSSPEAPSTPGVLATAPFGFWTGFTLPQLEALGLIQYEALHAGTLVLALEPTARLARPQWQSLAPGARVKASRFAQLRLEEGRAFIETPLAAARMAIADPTFAVLWAMLAQPKSVEECAAAAPAWGEETVRRCFELLLAACVAYVTDDLGDIPEQRDAALQLWSSHELMFHARSRIGRHDLPYGAWFLLRDRIPEPAPRPRLYEGPPILLSEPPADVAERCSLSLMKSMTARRSAREWDEEDPIGIESIGHLLWLSCRIKSTYITSGPGPVTYEHIYRPAPSAGSMGELEIYVLADRCAGLPAGAYHYDSHGHRLFRLPGEDSHRKTLLDGMQTAMNAQRPPQAALIVTARHPRMLWKYSSVGYSLELKDAGVLFQTWYLLSAALGIGACAVGMGDADTFCRLNGTNYYDESSIGEFALGSVPKN
ncbi:MAG TPA: SagB family peptide dehydrogenase [Bryobacteraceae bacterium]|nr:SagB family peptide dehydrogenase [Bryobacteraceae bacterium]